MRKRCTALTDCEILSYATLWIGKLLVMLLIKHFPETWSGLSPTTNRVHLRLWGLSFLCTMRCTKLGLWSDPKYLFCRTLVRTKVRVLWDRKTRSRPKGVSKYAFWDFFVRVKHVLGIYLYCIFGLRQTGFSIIILLHNKQRVFPTRFCSNGIASWHHHRATSWNPCCADRCPLSMVKGRLKLHYKNKTMQSICQSNHHSNRDDG